MGRRKTGLTPTVRERPGSNYLVFDYEDLYGRRRQIKSPFTIDKRKDAEKALKEMVKQLRAERAFNENGEQSKDLGPVTVRRFANRWLAERETKEKVSAKRLDSLKRSIRNHVLTAPLADVVLAEVTTGDIREFVDGLWHKPVTTTASGKLAESTVRLIYKMVAVMFEDAMRANPPLIDRNPCCLRGDGKELPKGKNNVAFDREAAVFSMREMELLISHPLIPLQQRVKYALLALAGLRFGEFAALHWRHWKRELRPLTELKVEASYCRVSRKEKGTKTGEPRRVPVHPVLAQLLAEWRLGGWAKAHGRPPQDDDLIVPNTRLHNQDSSTSLTRFKADLELLQMTYRWQHHLRRSFVTAALDCGANERRLLFISHGRNMELIIDRYTTPFWDSLCAQILPIRVKLLPPEQCVVPLPPEPEAHISLSPEMEALLKADEESAGHESVAV